MESTTLFSSESALLLVMFLMVAVGFWLQRFKVFKVLGPALTVIVTGIILSNLKIVPVSSPTYDALSSYCVPLSISICLLSLDLRQMKKLLNRNSIIALASAAVSVCLMAFVFGVLFASNSRDDYLQCEELCIPEQQYKRRFQQPDNGCCT